MITEALRHDGPALVEVSRESPGTLDAANDHAGAGEGLQPLHAQSRAERTRRRNRRSREDESFPVARAKQSQGFSAEEDLGIYSRLTREVEPVLQRDKSRIGAQGIQFRFQPSETPGPFERSVYAFSSQFIATSFFFPIPNKRQRCSTAKTYCFLESDSSCGQQLVLPLHDFRKVPPHVPAQKIVNGLECDSSAAFCNSSIARAELPLLLIGLAEIKVRPLRRRIHLQSVSKLRDRTVILPGQIQPPPQTRVDTDGERFQFPRLLNLLEALVKFFPLRSSTRSSAGMAVA